MKATIDIPDPIYKQVKARSALEGRTVRAVTIELYSHWLSDSGGVAEATVESEGSLETPWLEISKKYVHAEDDHSLSAIKGSIEQARKKAVAEKPARYGKAKK